MRSRSRLIVRGLKPEDFKCDLPKEEEEILCSDCGVVLKLAAQIIGGRCYCKECAPWYKEQERLDKELIEEDLKRSKVDFDKPIKGGFVRRLILIPEKSKEELEAELDFGERDYWD